MNLRRLAAAAVVLTAALACSATDSARTSARPGDAAGPSAHGPAASPGAARPSAPGGSLTASGAPAGPGTGPGRPGAAAGDGRPVLSAITDPAVFDATYDVRGEVVLHYLGIDHAVEPPPVARSTWEDLIATTWVRGRTAYGQIGFSLGYTDRDFRRVDHVILYVPSSRDAARPSDGYVDLPLTQGLPWLAAKVGETITAPTKDGRWDVTLRWLDRRSLSVTMAPRQGADTPSYFRSGTLTLLLNGPTAAPWRALGLRFELFSDAGRMTGDLAAVPR